MMNADQRFDGQPSEPIEIRRSSLSVDCWPHFLPDVHADEALEVLLRDAQWIQPVLRMYGKSVPMPRLTCWFGDKGAVYTYSGVRNEPHPWLPLRMDLRTRLEGFGGTRVTAVLANYYRDGMDYMSWHRDDETELGPDPTIASISLGASRRFDFRPLREGPAASETGVSLTLRHGSLLVMKGATQTAWQHAIPKARGERAPRVNLTFRFVTPRKRTW